MRRAIKHHRRHRRRVLAVAAVALVFVLTNTDWGREQCAARRRVRSPAACTAYVKMGRISGNMLKGLTLHDFAITDSSRAPFLSADSAARRLWPSLADLEEDRAERRATLSARHRARPPAGGALELRAHLPVRQHGRAQGHGWHPVRRLARVQGCAHRAGTAHCAHAVDARHLAADAQRDSALPLPSAGKGRTTVVHVAKGYQQVQEFQTHRRRHAAAAHRAPRLPLAAHRGGQPAHAGARIRAAGGRRSAVRAASSSSTPTRSGSATTTSRCPNSRRDAERPLRAGEWRPRAHGGRQARRHLRRALPVSGASRQWHRDVRPRDGHEGRVAELPREGPRPQDRRGDGAGRHRAHDRRHAATCTRPTSRSPAFTRG